MEEFTNNAKIAFSKALEKQTYNVLISSTIDNNANIKKVINVCAYIFDEKIDCGNGKAVISGKVGIKTVYIDTDNIINSTSSSQSFSETITDTSITSETLIFISERNIVPNIISTEGTLKINCEVLLMPVAHLNLPFNTNCNYENMIIKKSEVNSFAINKNISSNFDYSISYETKDQILKILHHDVQFSSQSSSCVEEALIIEGKLFSTIIYETIENEETKIKQLTDVFNIKNDISVPGVTNLDKVEIYYDIDKSKESISTDTEEGNNIINIVVNIKVNGVSKKAISAEIIDDMYSVENETELTLSTREYATETSNTTSEHNILGELSLLDTESAIEELISNLNISAELTNSYIKEESLFIEGIITSNIIYLDENKEICCKASETPFIVNTKQQFNNTNHLHIHLNITDCKSKVKRGTVVELEYLLKADIVKHHLTSRTMVDNVTIGKPVTFTNFDYQIYLAKPNETLWELCKRTKTTPELLNELNKDLPPILTGTEKIIIKR